MTESAIFLRDYIVNGSEDAFAQIVKTHVDVVYSAALRVVAGDTYLASDVTQVVFTDLVRKASKLGPNVVLAGWLYRHACFTAAKAVRTERRRQAREREAVAMQMLNQDAESIWRQITPVLDEAMNRLSTRERDAIVLRFFQQKPLREVGEAVGISEDAARKRVDRALNSLRNLLLRRGVTLSAAALVTVLGAKSVSAAPAGLAISLVSAAGAASSSGGILSSLTELLVMTKLQSTMVGLLFVAGVATPILLSSGASPGVANLSVPQTKDRTETANSRSGGQSGNEAVGVLKSKKSAALARLEDWVQRKAKAQNVDGGLDFNDQQQLRFLVWSLWARDYPEAWRLGERLGTLKFLHQFQQEILPYWAELDPHSALAAAESIKDHYLREDGAINAAAVWANRDPAAAVAWIRQSVPTDLKPAELAWAVPALAKSDPQAALAALSEITSPSLRQQALSVSLREWATQDPAGAVSYLTNEPPSHQRAELLKSVGEGWAQKDPEAISGWAQTLSANERGSFLDGAARALGEKDPAAAASLLKRFSSSGAISSVIQDWVKTDVSAAGSWVSQLPEGEFRNSATQGLLEQWGQRDPAGAADFAASLPSGKEQQAQIESILGAWSQRDAQVALDWVNTLPEGAARDSAVKGLCKGLGQLNPVEAANFVANLPPGDIQYQAAFDVATRWAIRDGDAAAQWVAAFPEGPTRQLAMTSVASIWADEDPTAASRWLAQLPASSSRDSAARQFVLEVAGDRPDLAAPWVSAIADEAQRNNQIESIATKWLQTDPDACRKWLQGTGLPQQRKQQLLAK